MGGVSWRRSARWCRPWAAIGVVAMGMLACGGDDNGQSGPYARRVRDAIPKIEKATGLTFKTPPRLEAQPRDSVRAFLERRFEEDMPQSELSGVERVYKLFGLIPAGMDLRRFMLDLLTEQVAGYYDPARKVLFVVEGGDKTITGITISHELVHALQDQYFNLDSLQNARSDNDRLTAGQSVIEGQATLEQIRSMIGGDNTAAIPGGWDRVRQLIRESQGSMPIFASAPTILQETLIFPYLTGAEFMRRYREERPGRSIFDEMPTSTEQLMHPDRYFQSRDDPTTVELPEPSSGSAVYENDLGEFETRVLLFEYLRDQSAAVRGAAGWDGDRYQLVETSRGDGLVWVTVWDSPIDAAEFFDLMETALANRFNAIRSGSGTQTRRTYRTEDRTFMLSLGDARKRPVVLFVDVPSGVSPLLTDFSRITLRE